MPRKLAALGFIAALVAFGSVADAASQKLWNSCAGNDPDAGIAACTKILAGKEPTQNEATAFVNRGQAYYAKGDYDLAIADFTRAIELNPKFAIAFHSRGVLHNDKGDYVRPPPPSTVGEWLTTAKATMTAPLPI